MVVVELGQAPGVGLLPVEELDHLYAGDALVEEGVDPGDPDPDVPVGLPDLGPEDEGGEEDQGEDAEGDERQTPVHAQHGADDEDQGEDVAEDRDDARAEEGVERLDVVGDPRHETPDGVLVVEPQVQALELLEDLLAQVVHHRLAQPGGEDALGVLEDRAQHHRAQVGRRQDPQEARVVGGKRLVDGELGEPGPHDLGGRGTHEDQDGQRHLPPVRLQVPEEALHEAGVVRLPQGLLFVEGGGGRSHGGWCRGRKVRAGTVPGG